MDNKQIKVAFSAKLNDQDTEIQSYGCRANNPNICAFVCEDQICRRPSRAWKKKYMELRVEVENE